jgi:hypothetical protein
MHVKACNLLKLKPEVRVCVGRCADQLRTRKIKTILRGLEIIVCAQPSIHLSVCNLF